IADEVLDPEMLTIGFARRFATYKRGTLLLRDLERLARILTNHDRPVQIVFAGKAHPQDNEGKELIRQIVQLSKQDRFRHRVVFLEDYDMAVARYLVQGADIWLNTPRRPLEASGTSGMKVAMNGGLNLSVLDGWWCEGYRGNNGWAIGKGEVYQDLEYQNEVESRALFDLLEKEIIPLFYERGADGIPRGWVAWMKASMQSLSGQFSTDRMVQDYTERFYMPALQEWQRFSADNLRLSAEFGLWRDGIIRSWSQLAIVDVQAEAPGEVAIGTMIPIQTRIRCNGIPVEHLAVDAYFGVLDSRGAIVGGELIPLALEPGEGELHTFSGEIECRFSGRHGFMVRVMPIHPEGGTFYEPGLITWG
ncbi:MAG TPA: alpha-glucan family phosphorylase, partial [Geobacterales bacterium]|nr:alpha-glucan family phosphorylase [Geobacterales bacterium]